MLFSAGDLAPDLELLDHLGQGVRLSQFWSDHALLLVFLRHLGCPLCFDHVARIRERFEELSAAGIRTVAVTMGDAAQAARFKESRKLPCDVLADPGLRAYAAYGLEKGGMIKIAGPQMWWAGFKSVVKYGAARPVGDIWQMPGAFLVAKGGKLLYAHRAANSGDLESYDHILDLFKKSQISTPFTRPAIA
jgi:peroxiredoxin